MLGWLFGRSGERRQGLAVVWRAGSWPALAVGESHYQDALHAIAGGYTLGEGHRARRPAHLVPEPDNPHDPLAVRVVIYEATVAYLSRDDARRFHDSLAAAGWPPQPAAIEALIVGGWDNCGDDWGAFGVRLAMSGSRMIEFSGTGRRAESTP